jgi:hypothetical protein
MARRQSSHPASSSGPRLQHEANGDASARTGETKPKRLRRRRSKAAAKRYETLLKLDHYDLQKSCETDIYYIGWYDKAARQTRRRTLNTVDTKLAMAEVERIDKSGFTGDPAFLLGVGVGVDIGRVLRAYQASREGAPSADFNRVAIDKYLVPLIGHIEVTAWKKDDDFEQLQEAFLEQGHSLGYFSRVCAVLRAALRKAEDRKLIPHAPRIPEPMSAEDLDKAPLKGRVMTPAEIAALIDQIAEYHFLNYAIAGINSGGRQATILGADTTQIDWQYRLFNMNAPGRRQNKKYRPTIRIAATWEPWLKAVPQGRLITYRGNPVASLRTAFRKARDDAKLKPDAHGVAVTTYSLRHSLGRYLEECEVPAVERSLLLGHEKFFNKRTTERYSPLNPRNPSFLKAATEAIEKFVREINTHTKKWDLLVPYQTKPGYAAVSRTRTTCPNDAPRPTSKADEEGDS